METPKDTIPSWVLWKSSTTPNEEAVVSYDSRLKRSSLTYYEIHSLATRFAHILKEGGVKKGDMVVNALPNCLEHIVTSLGIMMAGGVNIAVEVFMNTGETFYEVLQKTKTKLLIAQRGDDVISWNLIKDQLDTCSVTHGGLTPVTKSPNTHNLERAFVVSRDGTSFLDYIRSLTQTYSCPTLTPDDLCLAFSTSSATSLVRLVLHTHKSLVQSGKASRVILHGEKDYLNNTPPTWATNYPGDFLIWGVTRVSLDHWLTFKEVGEDQLLADVIEREKVDMTFMIPPLAEAVMKRWHPRPLKMVKHLIIGAMPVREKAVQKLMPAASRITVRYMSSESPGITYNTVKEAEQFHDFESGIPESDLKIRCVDEQFNDVRPKQTGRIAIKSDALFHSYIGEPEENTSGVFKPDGWFASADAGFLTPDGRLSVFGRQDDMILHNVWNIHPSWIENHIKSHTDVTSVAVVPIPDDINFQNICACVVQKTGSTLTASDIKSHYRSNYIEEEKDSFCPTDVLFFDKLPESRPGQVDRKRATEIATRLIQNAQQRGVPSDRLKTVMLHEIQE